MKSLIKTIIKELKSSTRLAQFHSRPLSHSVSTLKPRLDFLYLGSFRKVSYYPQSSCRLLGKSFSSSSSLTEPSGTCHNCGGHFSNVKREEDLIICQDCGQLRSALTSFNYFDLLVKGKKSFDLNLPRLKKVYLSLQMLLHPDRFSDQNVDIAAKAAFWSAFVNKAYETLRNPLFRAIYLFNTLNPNHPYNEEHTDSALDETELIKVLELREQIETSDTVEDCQRLCQETNNTRKKIIEEIRLAFEQLNFFTVSYLIDRLKFYETIQEAASTKLAILLSTKANK